jgi:ATP-dependent DNA ligase
MIRIVARPCATLAKKSASRLPPPVRAHARRPPAGPGWLHEVKHDGFRILARKAIDCRKFICTSGGEGQTGQVVPI